MRAISFSLYGSIPRYCEGCVRNVSIAPMFYPGWKVHVWLDLKTTPSGIGDRLAKAGAVIHPMPDWCINGMFGRFLVYDIPGVERFLCRDVDSRFCEREVKAVKGWIGDNTLLHVLRDHPLHGVPILGCGWGMCLREKRIPSMADAMKEWCKTARYGHDQDFLTATVWPKHQDSATIQDSCGAFKGLQPKLKPWPYDGPAFVGEYIGIDERPNMEHRRMRAALFGVTL